MCVCVWGGGGGGVRLCTQYVYMCMCASRSQDIEGTLSSASLHDVPPMFGDGCKFIGIVNFFIHEI